ncbi:MAG: hypothetical protein WBJ13_07270 [Sedimentibacter sp.]
MKIAAIHKPHKSLSSTLQFIGRFARTNAENIAEAKFVAINNEELWIEYKQLFIDDAIWQEVIIDLSQGKSKEVEEEKEYLSNFSSGISGKEFNDEDFPLHSLRPNCHAKVFKASNFKVESKFPEQMNIKFGPFINIEDNTVVAIGEEFKRPKWAISDDVLDIEYLLYIVHFQKSTGLLFVYSKMKTDDVYEAIASAFCDNYLKISKSSMHRVLGGLSEFEIFNSGMANKYGSGESYRISAGSDVSEAIDASTGMMFEAGHAFCKAKSNEETLTIGYSSGSKMWSSSYLPVYQFVKCVIQMEKS